MATKAELAAAAKEVAAKEHALQAESRALVIPEASGVQALAMLSGAEFESRLAQLKEGSARVKRIQKEYMTIDEDYGLIPGTPKPTLFKAGAEKLAQLYGLAARIESQFISGDNTSTPPLMYDSQCFLHIGSFAGPIVAVGHGTANSWERRYRRDTKVCPRCKEPKIIKSKFRPGWYCLACKSNFSKDDPEITEQSESATGDTVGAFDLGVTLMKMAEKRSFVDAVLRATATSGLFTQDVAEEPPEIVVEAHEAAEGSQEPEATVRVERSPVATNPEAQAAMADSIAKAADDADVADVADDPMGPAALEARAAGDAVVAAVVEATGGEEVVISPSAVADVQRGGRTAGANDAQIAEVRRLTAELGWGSKGLLAYVYAMFEKDEPEVPSDGREARGILGSYLEGMSSEDIGRLTASLRQDAELAAAKA